MLEGGKQAGKISGLSGIRVRIHPLKSQIILF